MTAQRRLIRRRALLHALLGAPAAALLAACGTPEVTEAPRQAARAPGHEALVLGGGVAGLAAAQDLRAAGADVLLLEARRRLGGRVFSDTSLGAPLDLGASWIHGVRGNPLSALAHDLGAATRPTDYEALQAYTADGAPIDDRTHARQIDSPLEDLLAKAEAERERRDEADLPDIPLQAAFDTALAGRSLSATARRALDYAINTTIEHEYAAAADELSLAYYDSAEGFSGGDVLFPGGYGQIVAGLSKDLVRELGAVVTRVTTERAGVGVSLADGRELRAERAIVALPLGVLQSGVVRFSPALPEAKRAALARMGSGVLNKLYLRFPRIFWDRDAELLGYVGERKGAWAEWLNIAFYTGEPLLLAFNAARYGRAVEALDDAAQVAEAMAVLRRIYGRSIPEPSGALASRWAGDPFARGSYSYLPPGARPGDYAALAAPVDGQLFFAGEHTSTENPATVHGALISGRIAAAALIDAA